MTRWKKDMLLQVDEDMIDAQSAAVLYGKLLQMCNGAIYGENRKIIELRTTVSWRHSVNLLTH